ncbi:MAG: F0F1 ATP synthase subunit delta [Candidatus Woesebacteria bacterium]|jgi:F-type H+-transporting ATPase subunit delta
MTVTIITARPLAKKYFSRIRKKVEEKYGKKVEYKQEIDKSMLAGIKIILGSKELDATIKGKLESIKEQTLSQISA